MSAIPMNKELIRSNVQINVYECSKRSGQVGQINTFSNFYFNLQVIDIPNIYNVFNNYFTIILMFTDNLEIFA